MEKLQYFLWLKSSERSNERWKKIGFFVFLFVKIVCSDLKTHYMHKIHQLFTYGGEKPPLLTNDFSNIENSKKFTTL